MNVQAKTENLELTMDELSMDQLNEANGGFVWIAAFVGGAAVGYGIRRGAEAIADWLGF